jgi:hypothetical protein
VLAGFDLDLLDARPAHVGQELTEVDRARLLSLRHQVVDGDEHQDEHHPQDQSFVALFQRHLPLPRLRTVLRAALPWKHSG